MIKYDKINELGSILIIQEKRLLMSQGLAEGGSKTSVSSSPEDDDKSGVSISKEASKEIQDDASKKGTSKEAVDTDNVLDEPAAKQADREAGVEDGEIVSEQNGTDEGNNGAEKKMNEGNDGTENHIAEKATDNNETAADPDVKDIDDIVQQRDGIALSTADGANIQNNETVEDVVKEVEIGDEIKEPAENLKIGENGKHEEELGPQIGVGEETVVKEEVPEKPNLNAQEFQEDVESSQESLVPGPPPYVPPQAKKQLHQGVMQIGAK